MKTNRKSYLLQAALLLIGLIMLGSRPLVHATPQQLQSGLSVSPAQASFVVTAENPSQTKTLRITNSYTTPIRLTVEFQAIDEVGARLVPSGSLDEQLANAIKTSETDIVIPANSSYDLRIAVDGKWLADGGHYASLLLSQRTTVSASSGFRSALAVNLFIIKNEHIRTSLTLTDVSFDRPLLSLPKTVSLVLQNSGNTHVVPRASVILYDGQDIVSKAVINTNSSLLLPGHSEKFTEKMDTLKRFWLPRRLIARTMYRIDGSDIQLVKEQVMWHIPLVDVMGLLAVILIVWRWRRDIRGIWTALHRVTKTYLLAKRRKKTAKKPSIRAIRTTGAVALTTKEDKKIPQRTTRPVITRPELDHSATRHVADDDALPPQALSETAKPAKRIVVTAKDDEVKAAVDVPRSGKVISHSKTMKKSTKNPSKTRKRSPAKAAKSPAAKTTKKKTS